MSSAYYRLKKHHTFKRFDEKWLTSCDIPDEQNDNLNSSIDLLQMNVTSNSPNQSQSMETNSEDGFLLNSSNPSDLSFEYSDRSPDVSLLDFKSSTPQKSPDSEVFDEINTNKSVLSFRKNYNAGL